MPRVNGGAESVRPWERIPAESSTAYAGFLAYRDLGVKRSIDAAWIAYQAATKSNAKASNHPSGQFCSQSTKFRWVARAEAWDDFIQAQRDRVAAQQAARWERRRLDSLEDNWQTAQALRKKVTAMLAMPISRTRSEDGKKIIEPAKWTFQTTALMARMVAELEAAVLTAVGRPDEMSDVEARAIANIDDDLLAPGPTAGIRIAEGD